MARKKISKSLSAITWVVMLFVFGGIFSGTETRSISWADDGKKVNDSSTVPTPIKISSGQILSRALLLDPSLLLAAKEAVQKWIIIMIQTYKHSIEQLLSQANSFLSLRPTSVIEKGEIPAKW